jgi:hypothetical protein
MSVDKHAAARAVDAHLASRSVGGFLLSFFVTVFLPILPGLLLAAAPQIATNPKLQAVLKEVDKVIDTLIGEP